MKISDFVTSPLVRQSCSNGLIPNKGKDIKVFVYRNLHKKCYSIRCMKTKRVIAHLDKVTLLNATFKVSPAGRDRVRRERRKNVHAGVVGIMTTPMPESIRTASVKVTYNPYRFDTFVIAANRQPIEFALVAELDSTGINVAL